jgi:hypothetical protein
MAEESPSFFRRVSSNFKLRSESQSNQPQTLRGRTISSPLGVAPLAAGQRPTIISRLPVSMRDNREVSTHSSPESHRTHHLSDTTPLASRQPSPAPVTGFGLSLDARGLEIVVERNLMLEDTLNEQRSLVESLSSGGEEPLWRMEMASPELREDTVKAPKQISNYHLSNHHVDQQHKTLSFVPAYDPLLALEADHSRIRSRALRSPEEGERFCQQLMHFWKAVASWDETDHSQVCPEGQKPQARILWENTKLFSHKDVFHLAATVIPLLKIPQ